MIEDKHRTGAIEKKKSDEEATFDFKENATKRPAQQMQISVAFI